jgi:hypothetical protein
MLVVFSAVSSCYFDYCTDGNTSPGNYGYHLMSHFLMLQGLLISCKCRRTDAACAIPSRCFDWARDSPSCSSDQHTESWRSGVCGHDQQPDKVCLYRWQGLCQSLGHQPAWLEEPCLPVRLPGEFLCVTFLVVCVNDWVIFTFIANECKAEDYWSYT